MLPLDYRFRVTTGSSRRPTPTEFVHRRKWAEPRDKYIRLTTTEQITNVSQQIDETDEFFVSNVFGRALSFILGQTDLGPRLIKGTLDGALHVAIDGLLSDTKNFGSAKIDIAAIGDTTLIPATAGHTIYVCSIVFTVGGDVNITFKSGSTPISGSMDFGGENEPRGMVIPNALAPLPCAQGEPFIINCSTAAQLSGYCTYFKQL